MIEIDKILNKATMKHSQILEEKIKKIIAECDCKPSDITIQVRNNTTYTILVKKDELVMDENYIEELLDD